MRYFLATLIFVTAVFAQALGVPSRGAAVSGKPAALRPVIGIPGAAVLGDVVAQGTFTLAPGQAWAAVDSAGALEIVRMSGQRAKVAGAATGTLRAFSPQGGRLAIYDGTHVTVVGGLPRSPAVSQTLGSAPASLTSLSLSEDGQLVLAVDASGATYRWSGDTWSAIAGANAISAVQVLGTSHRAVLVSGSLGNALLLQADGTLAQLASVQALGTFQVMDRVLLAGSLDGRLALAVAEQGTDLAVIDIESGNVQHVALEAGALNLTAGPQSEFAIGSDAATGAWLLDASRRLSYIPAAAQN
ncbi:MAG: hypothetical protein IT168_19865 [Bryobacterales bacterium]|nr:hypothetical protein [Bryobacterales bacterium]